MEGIDDIEQEAFVAHTWTSMLADFRENVYPNIFEPFGFTFVEAFQAWQLNKIFNELTVECTCDERPPEGF